MRSQVPGMVGVHHCRISAVVARSTHMKTVGQTLAERVTVDALTGDVGHVQKDGSPAVRSALTGRGAGEGVEPGLVERGERCSAERRFLLGQRRRETGDAPRAWLDQAY